MKTIETNLGSCLLLYGAVIALLVVACAELYEAFAVHRIAEECAVRAIVVEPHQPR